MLAAVPVAAGADVPGLRAYLEARSMEGVPTSPAYAEALARSGGDPLVAIRAYRAALRDGDLTLAEQAARLLRRAGVAPVDAALLPLAGAARAGDARAMEAAAVRLDGTPLSVLGPSIRAWAALLRGTDADPRPVGDGVARRLLSETRVLLLLARGRADEAASAFRPLSGTAPLDLRIAATRGLVAAGRGDAARVVLPPDDPASARLLDAGVRPDAATGIAVLLTRLAADLAGDEPSPLVVALGRAALVADPGSSRAALVLANALGRDGASTQALRLLDGIPATDPLAPAAAAARVATLAAAGRAREALAAAERVAAAPDAGPAAWQRLAQLYGSAGRWDRAVPLYARVAASAEGRGDWAAWMQYGEALERAGRWPDARRALEKAVRIAPAEPVALNFLGYARAEHGEALPASRRLLEEAHRLKPEDSSIADSLGWAYHLSGDTRRALPLIEGAAADQPDNAEVAEHLGDLYWSLGRRYEARYAWAAAAVAAEPDGRPRLAAKLRDGLPAGSARQLR